MLLKDAKIGRTYTVTLGFLVSKMVIHFSFHHFFDGSA